MGRERENLKSQFTLDASNDAYRLLYEFAPVGYLMLDDNKVIKYANAAATQMLNGSESELTTKTVASFIHFDDQNNFKSFLGQLATASAIKKYRARIIQGNGEPQPTEFHGKVIKNQDGTDQTLLIINDIENIADTGDSNTNSNKLLKIKVSNQNTELIAINEDLQLKLKQLIEAKFEIQEKEDKLNSIFNAAIEGIITTDESGKIESINKAMMEIFGFQKHELVGCNITKIMPSFVKELHNYIQTSEPKIMGRLKELEARRKNGTLLPVEISIAEYHSKNKRYFTGLIRDISERKRKEQVDKQHLDELAHVARLGLMGEMASGIAHELNQPLTAISAYSQVILRLIEDQDPDLKTIHETLQKISEQALRAGTIIKQMREFISRQTKRNSTVQINQLVRDAVNLCCDDCKQHDIKVQFKLEPQIPYVSVDNIQIEQVIMNLVKNSIDELANLPEGIPRRICIQTYLNKKHKVEVRIKDNGNGISEDTKKQLFNPFYTTKENGMGMGLSICRSIIEAHEGILNFNTMEGKGTTFLFLL